ncbi:MerR family transcriptional regulator [Streptomyces montanisoli]|nr:MerR family transcriptional regulator [Streptomyces montanisoli]
MDVDATPPRLPAPVTTKPGQSLFPVGVAARLLHTKAATLRAWESRYGLGPSGRTPGGHRRYSTEDLQRLQHMIALVDRGVAAAQAAHAVSASPARRPLEQVDARDLIAAMNALDPQAVTRLAAAALYQRGAQCAWTGVFTPALMDIGQRWEATGCGVECEHVTSGILEAALRQYAGAGVTVQERCPPVLLAAATEEAHTLPLTALSAALADRGRRSLLVGSLPGPHLAAAIRRTQPCATVVWAHARETADAGLLDLARACTAAPVHPAGPGWPDDDARLPRTLTSLADAVRTLTVP